MTDAGTEATNTRRRAPEAILIDPDLCKCCGICSELCPQHVFDVDELGHPTAARLDDCTSCRLCEWRCPDFAITIRQAAKPSADERPGAAARPGAGIGDDD